jgi:SIR2-like domain
MSVSNRATATAAAGHDSERTAWFERVRAALKAGQLAPYLGPGLLTLAPGVPVPDSYEKLADFLATKVALPKRARGNAWAAAQFVESRQHRATVTALMKQAFDPGVAPLPVHRWLVDLAPPLIVDTWYDDALRQAFAGRPGWLEVQGITRAAIGEARWFRAYDAAGEGVPIEAANDAKTLVYKPHGGAKPSGNFLITDADYVEVLTEIDIQNPIPECVRQRRTDLGFLFLGCHFNDQMLRTYARQIQKRSRGPNYAVFESDQLTRMERRFAAEVGLDIIVCPLQEAVERLLTA